MKDADFATNGFKYFLSDHLGSVSLVLYTDHDNVQHVEQQRYLPFGQPRAMPPFAAITSTDFTYTGQRALPDTGLMDYKARFYSPALGRFVQPDTLILGAANPQSWNRFSYTLNNPIKYFDPTGHSVACDPYEDDCHHPNPAPAPPPGNSGSGGSGGHCKNDPDCRNGDDGELPDSDEDDSGIIDILEKIIQDDALVFEDYDCFTQSPGTIDWTNAKCVDSLSFLLQDLATLFSSVSAAWTGALTILGCGAEGVGCLAGYGLGYTSHLTFFNPYESFFSGASFFLTIRSDLLTHDTYFNSLRDWGIGEDTKTGFATVVTGSIIVEPFLDAEIDIYSSGYNHGYFCGISTLAGCIGSTIINAFP